MFPDLYSHAKRKRCTVAEALHNETWISDLMHDLTAPLLVDYMMLWILIEAAQFNPLDQAEDEIFWARSLDSIYSANTTYDMQFNGSLEPYFPARVWNVWAPSWCKVFIWLMLQNRIWMADQLLRREWMNKYFCPLCIQNLETVEHLFVECPIARQLDGDQ
jgi:hypothetical protein